MEPDPQQPGRIRQHLNRPVHRRLAWRGRCLRFWHLHVVLTSVALLVTGLLVGGAVGFQAGTQLDAAHWQKLYGKNLSTEIRLPPVGVKLRLPFVAATTAEEASIPSTNIVDGVTDQGQVGQCACHAFEKVYESLFKKRTGTTIHVSCAFLYALVSDGHDKGANAWDFQRILQTYGTPTREQLDYPTNPPQQVVWPIRPVYYSDALAHRYSLYIHPIALSSGAGEAAVAGTENEIHAGRMVFFGHPVFAGSGSNGDFDVNQNNGVIDVPTQAVDSVGGHVIAIYRYFRTMSRNNTTGFFEAFGNWGRNYGINCDTLQYVPGDSGCVLISYRFMAAYGSQVVSYRLQRHVNPQAQRPLPFTQAGPTLDPPVPPPANWQRYFAPNPEILSLPARRIWVYGVCARDLYALKPGGPCGSLFDMAPDINTSAHAMGISPVGLTAVIAAECGFYTQSVRCDSQDGYFSFGCCQITVATAAQFGIGNGMLDGYWGPNTSLVRIYENYPPNGIHLAGLVLGRYAAIERTRYCQGPSDFPLLYVAWNAGPYADCGYLSSPYGQAGGNYYQNFLPWYYTAGHYARSFNPYAKPKPTATCGRPLGRLRVYGHGRGRYYKRTWTRCYVFTWPAYHWAQKAVRR